MARLISFSVFANQPRTRLHSQYDNGAVSQASKIQGREPVWINPQDAASRGIADGDPVTVRSNGTSRSLRARIVRDLLPGVARVPHADADGLHGFVEVSR